MIDYLVSCLARFSQEMHEPKVQSVTEGGAAAVATALVKEKPSSYVGAQDKGL